MKKHDKDKTGGRLKKKTVVRDLTELFATQPGRDFNVKEL